ncbi:hypothetical protein D3C77_672180 [compost metagenome]
MDVGCDFNLPYQRPRTASGKGYAGDVGNARHGQRIPRDLLQRLVADDGGDGQQFNIWVAPCQQHRDRIVMPRVAVQYDFLHDFS